MKYLSWMVAGVVGSVVVAGCHTATDVASAVVSEAGQAGMPSGGAANVGGLANAGGSSVGGSVSGRSNGGGSPDGGDGGDGGSGGDSTTCSFTGMTYQVGEQIGPCLCLPDGTVGHCTGALSDPGTCTYNGTKYQRGDAIGGCLCLADGSIGHCTGALPEPTTFNPVCPAGREPDLFEPSRCTFEETCKSIGCGDGVSEFGADGCRRPCESSADCATGQRCRFTELLGQDCATSSIELCGPQDDGSCSCTFNADCRNPHICVDAARFPVEEDCAVAAAANCQDVRFFYFNSAQDPGADPNSEVAKAHAACHEAAQARATEINCDLSP